MKKYKFYALVDKRDLNPFYIGITTRTLDVRLKEHIRNAKKYGTEESKNHRGEKAQYERMTSIGFENLDIYLIHEGEFETRKDALAYETKLIERDIEHGHDLENVIQRRQTENKNTFKRSGKRNPNARFRQPKKSVSYHTAYTTNGKEKLNTVKNRELHKDIIERVADMNVNRETLNKQRLIELTGIEFTPDELEKWGFKTCGEAVEAFNKNVDLKKLRTQPTQTQQLINKYFR